MPVQLIRAPRPTAVESSLPARRRHASAGAPARDPDRERRQPADRSCCDAPLAADATATARPRTYPFIDRVRGVAAVVIMLHHLVGYVPAADQSLPLPAPVHDFLWWYGGLAAQVFLVIGGFVGGLSLSRATPDLAGLGRFLTSRYLRLALPAVATLLYAIALSAVVPAAWSAFPLFDHFSWTSVLAHVLLLQDILGYPSLLTGFWYLPVDWQCSGLLALLFVVHAAILRRHPALSPAARVATFLGLAAPVAILSLFRWNGDPAHEPFATYYFGLVFLGALASLSAAGRIPPAVFRAYAAACAVAVVLQGRPQPAVALAAGIAIHAVAARGATAGPRSAPAWVKLFDGLGRISYALFLVHYPTIWGVTSLGRGVAGDDPAALAPWIGAAVPASLAVAVLLHRFVELPAVTLAGRLKGRRETPAAHGAGAAPLPENAASVARQAASTAGLSTPAIAT